MIMPVQDQLILKDYLSKGIVDDDNIPIVEQKI